MIGVFSINQKVVFSCYIYFLTNFRLCLQPSTSDKVLGYSKHRRLDGLAFTMHEKRPELYSSCLSQIIYIKSNKLLIFGKIFNDDYFKFLNFEIIRY